MPDESPQPHTARHEIAVYRKRFEVFARDVLAPAVWSETADAEVGAFTTVARLSPEEALAGRFEPVRPGWRWGPRWGRCWFRVRGACPEGGWLRFASGTEATIWVPSESGWGPVRGLDVNRDAWRVDGSCLQGGNADVLIEATCCHPWGVVTFEWDTADTHARWETDTPGRLERAAFARRDADAWRLHRAYVFATALLGELEPSSARAAELYGVLSRVTGVLAGGEVASEAAVALRTLLGVLHRGAAPSAPRGVAIGHAHIDTAWLWTLDVTRDKVVRSWANALELLDGRDGFTMCASQAVHYHWLERDAPVLMARLDRAVERGRWEPVGGMWVEPDASVPSGESLVRQCLRGTRYWRARYGVRAEQRVLFLPDTFGFPASLPNVMAHCGLDTFVTNKMSWNQLDPFPLTSFRWRGLGDATVLAHMTPGGDYNSACTPRELRKAERNILGRERVPDPAPATFLQPYGYGDGGGGPTEETVEHVSLAGACEGLPPMRHGTFGEFRSWLMSSDQMSGGLPEWAGELYLELHRGTTTTQGWLKRANLRLEEKARLAEWLVSAGPTLCPRESLDAGVRTLREVWDEILLHQFHDILPGTSITPVYDEARARLGAAEKRLDALIETHERRWARELGGDVAIDAARLVAGEPGPRGDSVRVDGEARTLDNGVVRVTLDECGRVVSLAHARLDRDGAEAGPLNRLTCYADRPMMWDAWDIDRYTLDTPVWTNDTPAESIEAGQAPGGGAELVVVRTLGRRSRMTQRVRLGPGSDRVEFHTELDWREDRTLLKAEFGAPVTAEHATCGVQFGHVTRPTHANTSWDRMRFEWPAHRWVDVSEPGFGLAVLTRGLYGHSCRGSTIGVSLARSPVHPDPTADRGPHAFAYAVMAHAGCWRTAGVDRQGEAFNRPGRVAGRGRPGRSHALCRLEVSGAGRVELSACKPGEDDPTQIVLRLVETRGARTPVRLAWGVPVSRVERVDGLEDPLGGDVPVSEGESELTLRPFEIAALRITRA
ncbi:MAG: alpha-mannosidase [Phycisphaerales bacterium JB040]